MVTCIILAMLLTYHRLSLCLSRLSKASQHWKLQLYEEYLLTGTIFLISIQYNFILSDQSQQRLLVEPIRVCGQIRGMGCWTREGYWWGRVMDDGHVVLDKGGCWTRESYGWGELWRAGMGFCRRLDSSSKDRKAIPYFSLWNRKASPKL